VRTESGTGTEAADYGLIADGRFRSEADMRCGVASTASIAIDPIWTLAVYRHWRADHIADRAQWASVR